MRIVPCTPVTEVSIPFSVSYVQLVTQQGMPKGTSRAEAMLNSEKVKPVALAVIELCFTEGISQLIRRKFC